MMTKITNIYYDVFTNETIQHVEKWWYLLGYHQEQILVGSFNLSSPAEEILRACKNGEWDIIDGELYEASSKYYFRFHYDPYWQYYHGSIKRLDNTNWHCLTTFCNSFEGRSIIFALNKIEQKLKAKKEEENKQKLIKDFEVWK